MSSISNLSPYRGLKISGFSALSPCITVANFLSEATVDLTPKSTYNRKSSCGFRSSVISSGFCSLLIAPRLIDLAVCTFYPYQCNPELVESLKGRNFSVFDLSVEINKTQSAVSIVLNWAEHASIIIECTNDDVNIQTHKADFVKGSWGFLGWGAKGEVLLSSRDGRIEIEGFLPNHSTWGITSTKAKTLIEGIKNQMPQSHAFGVFGENSWFSASDSKNCFNWGRAQLRSVGVEMTNSQVERFFVIPSHNLPDRHVHHTAFVRWVPTTVAMVCSNTLRHTGYDKAARYTDVACGLLWLRFFSSFIPSEYKRYKNGDKGLAQFLLLG